MDAQLDISVSWPPASNKRKWAGVARMGGVGDNLIAASPLGALKRAGYMVEVISQEPHSCVFENNPFIDKLSVKRKEDFPQDAGLQWQLWFASRAGEYDRFAHFSHSCEHLIAFFPAQTAFWWPVEFRRKLAHRSYIEAVHDIMGVPYDFGPLFHPTDDEKQQALETKARVGEKIIGWCLSGTRIDKVYPYAPMAVARIIKETGIPVVLFGAPTEKDISMAQCIQDHVGQQNGSIAGLITAISKPGQQPPNWPIRRILTFAGVCDLVIGPDTGPMWGVAFEQMPKVLMISHASPENITKHWINTTTLSADPQRVPCWPCHRLHDVPQTCVSNKENNGAACVSDISVETVVTTIKEKLNV